MSQPVLTYYAVSPDVLAFSTTRHGGVSQGRYGELNINPYCGDEEKAVASNRQALTVALRKKADGRCPLRALLLPHQVHETQNVVVTEALLGLPDMQRAQALEGKDSLTTDRRGICVGVSTADCIPVLLYDPVHHAVAAIHAGWRGTVKRIVRSTMQAMREHYGTQAGDVKAVIGPGISLKNFEVGQEVYDKFSQAGFAMEAIARRYPAVTSASGLSHEKWHIDLPQCNTLQLEAEGVPAGNILKSGICTYDHVDDYFSARRLGTASGRIYTGIMLL